MSPSLRADGSDAGPDDEIITVAIADQLFGLPIARVQARS